MGQAARSWVNLNPDLEFTFWDDQACRQLIDMHSDQDVLEAYTMLPRGALRADLWRYFALYVHGGVYADIDTV
jgi:mannosyltransferase OCH1-like enzyme